jgi:hypothetical protein
MRNRLDARAQHGAGDSEVQESNAAAAFSQLAVEQLHVAGACRAFDEGQARDAGADGDRVAGADRRVVDLSGSAGSRIGLARLGRARTGGRNQRCRGHQEGSRDTEQTAV